MIVPVDSEGRCEAAGGNMLPSVQTVGNNLSRLDAAMHDILNSKEEKFRDDREKCRHYLQALQKYLHFVEKKQNKKCKKIRLQSDNAYDNSGDVDNTTISENGQESSKEFTESDDYEDFFNASMFTDSPLSTKTILNSVPKSYMPKALQLLNVLQENENIDWNKQGVVKIGEKTIPNSSISDLVNSALRKRKNISDPTGWEEFSNFIINSQLPETVIGNADLIKKLENKKTIANSSSQVKRTASANSEVKESPKTVQHKVKKWLNID